MPDKKEVLRVYRDIITKGRNAVETSAAYALKTREVSDEQFVNGRSNIEDHTSMLVIALAQSIEDLDNVLNLWENE